MRSAQGGFPGKCEASGFSAGSDWLDYDDAYEKERMSQTLKKIQEKAARGDRLSAYVACALTGVPKSVFPYHIEFINAARMLLQYRYGMNPYYAALDNEGTLDGVPVEKRAAAVYYNDQHSVVSSDLIVADFSVLSFGGGEEVERASANGIPIIGVVATGAKKKGELTYYLQSAKGALDQKKIHIGNGGASMMLYGAPGMKGISTYPAYDRKTMLLQKIEDIGWHMEYNAIRLEFASKAIAKAGVWLRKKSCRGNPRSLALKEIDLMLREGFKLAPVSEKLGAEMEALGKTADPANMLMAGDVQKKIRAIEGKKGMLDDLLDFHPMKTHAEYEKYKMAFPEHAVRITPNDGGPARHERVITPKFMPPIMRREAKAMQKTAI